MRDVVPVNEVFLMLLNEALKLLTLVHILIVRGRLILSSRACRGGEVEGRIQILEDHHHEFDWSNMQNVSCTDSNNYEDMQWHKYSNICITTTHNTAMN